MSTSHCPSCHASVASDAPWCQLCHLDLRPPAEVVAVAVDSAVDSAEVPRAMLLDPGAHSRGRHARVVGWPCAQCDAENDLESTTCATCGSGFLAGLQADDPTALRLPLIGDVSKLGRSSRVAIAVGAAVLLALLLSGVLALAGAVL